MFRQSNEGEDKWVVARNNGLSLAQRLLEAILRDHAPPRPTLDTQGMQDSMPIRKKLVLLVHGIRTRALWQKRIEPQLRNDNTVVEAVGYRYFNVFEFLSPLWTRKKAIEKVQWRIEKAIDDHPEHELILLAHSFGTYCVARILQSTPRIKPTRIILCGSVEDDDFRWDLLRQQPKVVNECGTRDIWPCLARSSTWGYGSAGTFGFKTPGITDRYHAIPHSGFFEDGFARKYWAPFIADGTLVESHTEATLPEPPSWMSLIAMRPLRLPWLGWLVLFVSALIIFTLWSYSMPPTLKKLAVVAIYPSDSFGPDCHEGFVSAMRAFPNAKPVKIDGATIADMKAGRMQSIEQGLRKAFSDYRVVGVVGPPISEISLQVVSLVVQLNPKVPVLLTSAISANDPTWQFKRHIPLFRVGSGIGQRAKEVQTLLKQLHTRQQRIVFLIENHSEGEPRSFGHRFFDEVENQMGSNLKSGARKYHRLIFPSRHIDAEFQTIKNLVAEENTVLFLMGLDFQMRDLVEEFYRKQPDRTIPRAKLIGWMNAHALNTVFQRGDYYSNLVLEISDFSRSGSQAVPQTSWIPDITKRDAMNYHDSTLVILNAIGALSKNEGLPQDEPGYVRFLSQLGEAIAETEVTGIGGRIHFDASGQNDGRSLVFLTFESEKKSWTEISDYTRIFFDNQKTAPK